jgi:hypothetical protein
LVQNIIKVLTLGFFISMITGFVLYRSGYFDATTASDSLQVSPNGGELYIAQVDQDSTKSPQQTINGYSRKKIMPSTKSAVPIFDMESVKQDMKKQLLPSSKSIAPIFDLEELNQQESSQEILPSSKSMTYPIDIKPEATANEIENEKREDFKKQPELVEDLDDVEALGELPPSEEAEMLDEVAETIESSEPESTHINWRGIWIGVLGILFVALGSIVYFKRRSK